MLLLVEIMNIVKKIKKWDPLRNVVWSNNLKHTKTCSFHMKPNIEII